MPREQFFSPGDSEQKLLSASYLNTLERRLARLENMYAGGDVEIVNTYSAVGISKSFSNKTYHFVKLKEELAANGTAEANLMRWDSQNNHFEDDNVNMPTLTVEDFNGVKSCDNTIGIALEHPESTSKKYIFIPWPLGCGTHIENYDAGKRQVLTHMPVSEGCCLRWENVITCE